MDHQIYVSSRLTDILARPRRTRAGTGTGTGMDGDRGVGARHGRLHAAERHMLMLMLMLIALSVTRARGDCCHLPVPIPSTAHRAEVLPIEYCSLFCCCCYATGCGGLWAVMDGRRRSWTRPTASPTWPPMLLTWLLVSAHCSCMRRSPMRPRAPATTSPVPGR